MLKVPFASVVVLAMVVFLLLHCNCTFASAHTRIKSIIKDNNKSFGKLKKILLSKINYKQLCHKILIQSSTEIKKNR